MNRRNRIGRTVSPELWAPEPPGRAIPALLPRQPHLATVRTNFCLNQQEAVLKATAVRSPLPVMSSILSCPHCIPEWGASGGRGVQGQGGSGVGVGEGRGGLGGKGQGTFHLPCHTLHYHMVLCPKGTSHNQDWNA